jgi:hypothetical protein
MARSLFLIILVMPVKNAHVAEIPAKSIGKASAGRSKNVSPPLWPEARNKYNIMKNRNETTISIPDHLPRVVFGL